MLSMPRVNEILQHSKFNEYLERNKLAEENRVFCRHGFDHGLTVARITYIYLLEEGNTTLSKELIYAAGLLHDIGRWIEYDTKEDHAVVGARLADPILRDCGFTELETETIRIAIAEHRLKIDEAKSLLGQALVLADDWARDCISCPSKSTCYKYSKSLEEIIC